MVRSVLAWSVVGLMILVCIRYIGSAIAGASQPIFATWFLFWVGANASYWTYFATPKKKDLTSNIANLVDVAVVWLITGVIIFLPQTRWDFTIFEIGCLLASFGIFLFWRRTRQHEIANLCLQIIMSIAYFPTLAQLWHAEITTEPIVVWLMCWTASVIGFYLATIAKDKLAQIYAFRAGFFVSFILILIFRIETR